MKNKISKEDIKLVLQTFDNVFAINDGGFALDESDFEHYADVIFNEVNNKSEEDELDKVNIEDCVFRLHDDSRYIIDKLKHMGYTITNSLDNVSCGEIFIYNKTAFGCDYPAEFINQAYDCGTNVSLFLKLAEYRKDSAIGRLFRYNGTDVIIECSGETKQDGKLCSIIGYRTDNYDVVGKFHPDNLSELTLKEIYNIYN